MRRPLRHLKTAAAVGVIVAACSVAGTAAETDFISPTGITLETPGALIASDAFVKLSRATTTYLSLGKTASPTDQKLALDAATSALRSFESSVPGAKRDTAAFVAELKRAGRLSTLDKEFFAKPTAFLATPGEVAAVKAAGGPAAVLSVAAKYYDQDLADFRAKLGATRTAWRFDLSPIPAAHAGTACSVAAWTMKMTCLGFKKCYNFWAKANYDNCM